MVTNIQPAVWSGTLRDQLRTPYATEAVPLNPTQRWEERYGRGYTDVPVVEGNLLIATSTAKTISVMNAESGARFWERRTNGPVVGGPNRLNERIYLATQSGDGRVEAFSLARGRRAWKFEMGSPAVGGALLADSILYTGSERGELFALHIGDGRLEWRTRLPAGIAAAPLLVGGSLVVITATDSVLRVDRSTGHAAAAVKLTGSVSAPVAVRDGRLYVALQPDELVALDAQTLATAWRVPLHAPILAAPAPDADGSVFVLTRAADVWRVDANGSASRIAQLGGAAAGSLTLTRDGLLVGKLDGTLVFMKRDGSEVWRRQFRRGLRTPVAVHNGRIYVPMSDGRMVMMQ